MHFAAFVAPPPQWWYAATRVVAVDFRRTSSHRVVFRTRAAGHNLCGTLVLLCVLLLPFCSSADAVTTQDVVNEISLASFQSYLYALPTHLGDNRCINYRLVDHVYQSGSEHDVARDEIFLWFRRSGWTTFIDPISVLDTSGNLWTGANVVAIKQGTITPDKIYLIMAHYDSTASRESSWTSCPGADDNGTGVAALLEMARVLSRYTFDSTIMFVACDGEETTAYGADGITYRRFGSAHYVNKYASLMPCIQAMISADMFGWVSSAGPSYLMIVSGWSINTALDAAIQSALRNYGGFANATLDTHKYEFSDHISFINKGVPAVCLIEWNYSINPNYHRMTDSVDTPNYINYTYATNVVKGMTGWLCEQAGLSGGGQE